MTKHHRTIAAIVVVCALCSSAAGCATVAPYERERLARRDMSPRPQKDTTAGEDHATVYREGSTGGGDMRGGGCGCN